MEGDRRGVREPPPSRRRVDPGSYGALHRDLLADCRAAAEAAGPGGSAGREELEELELLVRPWLSPKSLAQADREILEGLLDRCRAVERRLGGRRRPPVLRAAARLATPAVVVAGSCVLVGALAFATGTTLEWVRDWSDVLWSTVGRSSDLQRMAVAAAVVVGVSIRVVSRTARS